MPRAEMYNNFGGHFKAWFFNDGLLHFTCNASNLFLPK